MNALPTAGTSVLILPPIVTAVHLLMVALTTVKLLIAYSNDWLAEAAVS
jgi:hypothetical protein